MKPFKRRVEKKTDYKARLALLKSDKPRLVVRRYNRNIRIQIIEYGRNGDRTIVEVNSSKMKNGWNGHPGNLPSAYLAGYEAGLAALSRQITDAVLDMGLQTSTKGNAIYAAAKGAADAGLQIPLGEETQPDESRVKGSHISEETARKFEEVLEKMKSK